VQIAVVPFVVVAGVAVLWWRHRDASGTAVLRPAAPVTVPTAGADCASSRSRRTWLSGARVERRLATILAADVAGYPRLLVEDEAVTVARLADIAPAMCDFSDELVADLGHICDAWGVGLIEVTALPLSPPVRRIIAEAPDLVPRLAGAGDDYELVFASPPHASPAIECLLPELALPITATGAVAKAGVRLVNTGRKRLPITASGLQHF
jgi:class 3 adenylate cyclase